MALLDQVKKSLTSGFQLPKFGQSEKIKELQAATAGRALLGGEGGPAQGSQAEMIAAAGAQEQQKEDVLQGQMAAAGLEQQAAQQEQQFQQKQAFLDEESLNIRQQTLNKTQDILQDFFQRKGELDFKEESSRVQYAIASMRLSNDDYLDRLEAEAARSRLEDQTAFDWELTQSIFREELGIFKNDLDFKRALGAEERDFKEYMAEFNLDQAIQLSQIDMQAAESAAQYQAMGQLASAGGQALAAAYSKKDTPKTTQPTEELEFTDTSEDTVDLGESMSLSDNSTSISTRPLNTDIRTIETPTSFGIRRGPSIASDDIPDYSQGRPSLIQRGRVNPDDTFF